MIRSILCNICLLLAGISIAHSQENDTPTQETFVRSYTFSTFCGLREIKNQRFPFNETPDFANYIFQDTTYSEFSFSGFAGNLALRCGLEVDARIAFYASMRDAYIGVKYRHQPWLTYSVGYFSTGYWRSRVPRFQPDEELSHYSTSSSEPFETAEITDRGVEAGVHTELVRKRMRYAFSFNAGVSSFAPFGTELYQQHRSSNYRRWIVYQTNYHYEPFVRPEIAVSMDIFQFSHSVLGLRLFTNMLLTYRSIPYEMTVYEWTTDNSSTQTVAGAKHLMSRFDSGFALFLRFE